MSMYRRLIRWLKIYLVAIFIGATSGSLAGANPNALGTDQNPIKISLVPGQDAGVLQNQGAILAHVLEQKTGLKFKVLVPFNFITVVETFGTARTDIAMINSFGYLLAHEKYGAQARLIGTANGRAEYWGQIITAKPNIKKLTDLKDKKIAYVDPASTSGFILPSSLFQKKKIVPKEFIFAGKHDSVVTAVYLGQVDAGATYHTPAEKGEPQDARRLVKTQFPDVFSKVRILEIIGPIPSDPVVFRKDFPAEMESKIILALVEFASSAEGQATLKALYNIDGFQNATDKNYDSLRAMMKEIGKAPEEFIK